MAHPLVDQLRFTRAEWRRALRGIAAEDGLRRIDPMNSIGWIVGHLAWQEQWYWLTRAQDTTLIPSLNDTVASGADATTPPLLQMLAAWRTVTKAVDPWLDGLSQDALVTPLPERGRGGRRSIGDSIHRVTYHYWFHIGEVIAIRQLLGHARVPEYVGEIEARAPYRPE